MPQLNPEFFISQLFWLIIFFSFLLIFLWKISLPRIASVIEKRQNKIDENLSTAKNLQDKAKEIEKNINIQINNAKVDSENKLKNTIDLLQENVSSKLSSLDKELDLKISNAEKKIIENKDKQMKTINDEISNITKITVAKISDIKLSDSVVEQAVKSYKGKIN